jgi:hypothetical protein
MKLASEKSFNKAVCPVMDIKGKTVEYPFILQFGNSVFVCAQGILGPKQVMVMDVLGTGLIHMLYNNTDKYSGRIPIWKETRVKQISGDYMSDNLVQYFTKNLSSDSDGKIPEAWYSDKGLINIDLKYERIKKPITLVLNDGVLRRELPFLKGYSSVQIAEMIRQTSECVLNMTYPIRHHNGNEYKTVPFNNYQFPTHLFTLIKTEPSKWSKDNHILERKYTIRFDTILGYVFMQNVLSCHTDLVPGKFYEMSDYAQLFYRIFILPYFGKVKNPISIDEIRHRLVLKTSDTYMVRKVIKRILDELAANRFICDPQEVTKYDGYLYGYKKNNWKDMIDCKEGSSETDWSELKA